MLRWPLAEILGQFDGFLSISSVKKLWIQEVKRQGQIAAVATHFVKTYCKELLRLPAGSTSRNPA